MTQLCIEEAIVMRLRSEEMKHEKAAEEEAALQSRLHEIASRQGGRR